MLNFLHYGIMKEFLKSCEIHSSSETRCAIPWNTHKAEFKMSNQGIYGWKQFVSVPALKKALKALQTLDQGATKMGGRGHEKVGRVQGRGSR